MLLMRVAFATLVSSTAVKPTISDTPNRAPGSRARLNKCFEKRPPRRYETPTIAGVPRRKRKTTTVGADTPIARTNKGPRPHTNTAIEPAIRPDSAVVR